MESVVEVAREGGPVLGIRNGFQVLCEAGLLPGALLPNRSLRFVCRQGDILVDIAGVCNAAGNVLGLMPHPEHAVDPLTGSADGGLLFESVATVAAAA